MFNDLSQEFHGSQITEYEPYATFAPNHIIVSRELSYRFFSHFHPYVGKLIRRLVEESVDGLLEADTEYEENGDGTLRALPHSTLAALKGDTNVTGPGDDEQTLPIGTRVHFLDGAVVQLPSGNQVVLPGNLVLSEPRGVRVTVSGGKETIPFGTEIVLKNDAPVILPNGAQATLPAGTALILIGCKPQPKLFGRAFFETIYKPNPDMVRHPHPAKDLDFTSSGAYSVYNWELFYHVPITIAIHLSKNQRYEEAMQWFHYVFDPTDNSSGPTPERFWKVKPFQYTDVKKIEEILVNLSTGADPVLWQDTFNSIGAWKDAPFRPHLVARYRQTAYMYKVVMAYCDTCIACGDMHFREDTGESINEAQQYYVLAANILGIRPQAVPKKGSVRPQTYATIKKDLEAFGNALVDFETDIPFDYAPFPGDAGDQVQFSTLSSIGQALYFCVPRNDKLLGYWDTVADRLFKIRNSLNIQGIFRQLPLFEPPIDPALLAKAVAAGLDIGAVISGLNQPLPLVRFQVLVQKAAEVCQEVKSLGNNLLSAIEKEDNEALAMLRARHERVILELVETVKYAQWQEAIKVREGLEISLANVIERYTYYERQLGKNESEITTPELEALEEDGLVKMKFKASEPEVELRTIEVDISPDLSGEGGGKKMNVHEVMELTMLKAALGKRDTAATIHKFGAALAYFPDIEMAIKPFGAGSGITFGGSHLANAERFGASFFEADADELTYKAGNAAKIASYARREQDWAFNSNLAAGEITQIYKQIRAAQIREFIAERELRNHRKQIHLAEDIERFLDGEKNSSGHKKTSTQGFYTWNKREVKGLYGQVFQFAFDIAKKAERALQHELGDPQLSFLQFGYLAGKEGLLAGEKLYLDLKRMEMAYHELNQREYELTRHASLLQVNPLALIQLRATGRCTVFLPEELFDMDGPGHYFRRIKTVAVSIPCVAGPYTSINCTLTLLKSSVRINPILADGEYARNGGEDSRFNDHFGSLQSIVTSTGQNDSGLFETNLRDERYLPFEGSGVISEWQLELPAEVRQFDYDTISDVILHVRYTAREGGGLLRNGAVANLNARIEEAQAAGSVRLFSVRHEFPSEWAKFQEQTAMPRELVFTLRPEHFPFWSKRRLKSVKRVDAIGRSSEAKAPASMVVSADGVPDDNLTKDTGLNNLLMGELINTKAAVLLPDGLELRQSKLRLDRPLADLWLAVRWSSEE